MAGCAPDAPGGISQVIHDLTHGPLANEWPLDVCRTWVPGPAWKRAMVFAQSAVGLWIRCIRGEVQAIHLHMATRGSFWRKWLLAAPLGTSSIRLIIHLHDGRFPEWQARQRPMVRRLLRRFLERADAVVVLSHRWAQALAPLAPRARFHVVPNAIDAPPQAARHRYEGTPITLAQPSHGHDPRSILFLGRLTPDKGTAELLEAARILAPAHPGWHWTLAGDGPRQALIKRAQDMGLQKQVYIPGSLIRSAKWQALARADVLVLPSWAEGQPLAVLEAMACAVPVVATSVGDVPDLLACGAGLVVPPKDSAALASAVQRVLQNPTSARAMGETGQAHVRRHHGHEAVAANLSALYHSLGLRRHAAIPETPIGNPSPCSSGTPERRT